MSKSYKLRAPHFVSEDEFFKYLDGITNVHAVKEAVIIFYCRLLKYYPTLQLTKENFDACFTITNSHGKIDTTDQAQYLFKDRESITMAELFRFQFVNYVKKITLKKHSTLTQGGTFHIIGEEIVFFNSSTKKNDIFNSFKKQNYIKNYLNREISLDEYSKHYFSKSVINHLWKQEKIQTILHELTHIFAMRSYDNGAYRMVFGHQIFDMYNKNSYCRITDLQNKEFKNYIKDALVLLNEVITDVFSHEKLKYYKCDDTISETLQPKVVVEYKGKEYNNISLYLAGFHYLFPFILFTNKNKTLKDYLLNPKQIEQTFSDMSISPQLRKKVISAISTEIGDNVSTELWDTGANNLLKICLGISLNHYKNMYMISACAFGNLTQAIFLENKKINIERQLKSLLAKTKVIKSGDRFITVNKSPYLINKHRKQAEQLISEELNDCEELNSHILKPNIKATMPMPDGRIINMRDKLSVHDLSRNFPKYTNLKCFDEYLQSLAKFAKKINPKLLDNDFMKKECDSYAKEKALNKYLKTL